MRTPSIIVAALLSLVGAARVSEAAPREDIARHLVAELAVKGGRLDVASLQPSPGAGCRVEGATAGRAIDRSGRFAIRLDGRGCPPWTWARIEVWAPVLVTTRALRAGEALTAAVALHDRHIVDAASLTDVPGDFVAARALAPGASLADADVAAPTLAAGTPIKVVVHAAGLAVELSGRSVPCARGRACAVLPSGRHVEGLFADGRLLVDLEGR